MYFVVVGALMESTSWRPGDGEFFGKLLDLEMLVCFGGQERTEDEYRELLTSTGFRLTRVIPTRTPSSIVEAIPC